MLLAHIGDGGDWTAAMTMSKGLSARGHELLVAAASVRNVTNPVFRQHIEATINRGPVALFRSAICQRRLFPTDLDILHAHSPSALLYAILIRWLRCPKAKIVMTFHWEVPESILSLIGKRWLFRIAHRLHVYSQETLDYFRTTYKVSGKRVDLIYLGTDTQLFPLVSEEERRRFREQFSLPAEALVLATAGRLNPEKNIPVVLNFMNQHAMRYPQLHLLVVGDGPMRAEYEAIAKAGPASHRIHFTGMLRPIRNGYGASDLLLLPSTSMETFGLVCVEAGLCGVPTLRSNIAGALDQIEESRNGWVYPKEQDKAFEATLHRILESPEQLRKAGIEARKIYLEKFSMEGAAHKIEMAYRSILAAN